MTSRLASVTVLGISLLKVVEGRRCSYQYESGMIKEFFCNAYEFCCGGQCCRARSIGFFQLWYFWLLIMLMLLLCSGGGWWVRYRRRYQMGGPPFGMPTATPAARSFASGGGFQRTCHPPTMAAPPPYVAGYPPNGFAAYAPNNNYPPNTAGYMPPTTAGYMPPPHQPNPQFGGAEPMAYPYPPAPAYMGAPPSYAAATATKPS